MQLPEQEDLEIPLRPRSGPQGAFYTTVENDVEQPGATLKKSDLAATSTKDPSRPRTWAAGYAPEPILDEEGNITGYHDYGTMTVVFRDDKPGGWGVWWNYYEVPDTLWNGFDDAYSKGEFLRESGLDNWFNMGAADPGRLGRFEEGRLKAVVLGARNKQRKMIK
jgi:hypothetical protein